MSDNSKAREQTDSQPDAREVGHDEMTKIAGGGTPTMQVSLLVLRLIDIDI